MSGAAKLGLAVSVAGLTLFLMALMYAGLLLPATARGYVTELDRAGVFREDRLQAYDPALAGPNLRVTLGPWVAQSYYRAAVWLCMFGMATCALSAVLFGAVLRGARNAAVSASACGRTADGGRLKG